MRYQGRLHDWNDEKGYGFVTPNGGGDRAFAHIKAFERSAQRPANGQLISYVSEKQAQGRINATQIRFVRAGKAAAAAPVHGKRLPRTTMGVIALLCVGAAWRTHLLPDWLALAIGGLSLLALVLYATDKAAAQRGQWRTPESTLHMVALLGGWPGALLAQGICRHKSSKHSFQIVFWATVVINLIGLAALTNQLRGDG